MDEVFWKRDGGRHATPFIVIVVDKLLWALKETGPRAFLKVIYMSFVVYIYISIRNIFIIFGRNGLRWPLFSFFSFFFSFAKCKRRRWSPYISMTSLLFFSPSCLWRKLYRKTFFAALSSPLSFLSPQKISSHRMHVSHIRHTNL